MTLIAGTHRIVSPPGSPVLHSVDLSAERYEWMEKEPPPAVLSQQSSGKKPLSPCLTPRLQSPRTLHGISCLNFFAQIVQCLHVLIGNAQADEVQILTHVPHLDLAALMYMLYT
jgi:hypothetical protein